MNIKFIKLLFLSLLILSCNIRKDYPGTDFKKIGELYNGDTIIYDVPCTNIRSMYIVDSLVVLHCDNTIDKKLLQVYDINSGNWITSFVQYGRGPAEVDYADVNFKPKEKLFQFITDHGHNIQFCIDSVMNGNPRGTSINLNTKLRGDQYSFIDTLLFSSAAKFINDFYRFAIMTPRGDTIFCYRDGTQKRTPVVLKPDYTRCFTYSNGNFETEILTLSASSINLFGKCTYIDPNKALGDDIIKSKDYPGIVNYPFPTDKYIYTPWSESLNPRKATKADKVVIFDWDGKANGYITIEKIDGLEGIMNIDEYNKQFFLVVKNPKGQLNIVRYDMSHLPL